MRGWSPISKVKLRRAVRYHTLPQSPLMQKTSYNSSVIRWMGWSNGRVWSIIRKTISSKQCCLRTKLSTSFLNNTTWYCLLYFVPDIWEEQSITSKEMSSNMVPVSMWQLPTAKIVCCIKPFFCEKNSSASWWALLETDQHNDRICLSDKQ